MRKSDFVDMLLNDETFSCFVNHYLLNTQINNLTLCFETVESLLDLCVDENNFYRALERFSNEGGVNDRTNEGEFPDCYSLHVQQTCLTYLVHDAPYRLSHLIDPEEIEKVCTLSQISPIPLYIFDDLLQLILQALYHTAFPSFAKMYGMTEDSVLSVITAEQDSDRFFSADVDDVKLVSPSYSLPPSDLRDGTTLEVSSLITANNNPYSPSISPSGSTTYEEERDLLCSSMLGWDLTTDHQIGARISRPISTTTPLPASYPDRPLSRQEYNSTRRNSNALLATAMADASVAALPIYADGVGEGFAGTGNAPLGPVRTMMVVEYDSICLSASTVYSEIELAYVPHAEEKEKKENSVMSRFFSLGSRMGKPSKGRKRHWRSSMRAKLSSFFEHED